MSRHFYDLSEGLTMDAAGVVHELRPWLASAGVATLVTLCGLPLVTASTRMLSSAFPTCIRCIAAPPNRTFLPWDGSSLVVS